MLEWLFKPKEVEYINIKPNYAPLQNAICAFCKHYGGEIAPGWRGERCKVGFRLKQNYVTGEVKKVYEFCVFKNIHGNCQDFDWDLKKKECQNENK